MVFVSVQTNKISTITDQNEQRKWKLNCGKPCDNQQGPISTAPLGGYHYHLYFQASNLWLCMTIQQLHDS